MIRCRIRRMRRARAASFSWAMGEGMRSLSGRGREAPARTLRGSWAMRTTVIFDLDGVLVDSRAVFISCVNHAFVEARPPDPPRRGARALHRPAVPLRLR